MYKNGFLPNNFGWMKQANKLIEIIGFIDIEIAKHNKESENKNVRQSIRNSPLS